MTNQARSDDPRVDAARWSIGVPLALVAAAVLLSAPSGVDYLYYYLPAAEHLWRSGWPERLLPSRNDAPFAYPPAEYLLLASTFLAGSWQGLAIRALGAAKVVAWSWLLGRLAKHTERPRVLALASLLPSTVQLLFTQATDTSALLAVAAAALLALDASAGPVAAALVGYALCSKYTFLPVYAAMLAWFAVRRPRSLGWLLAPLPLFALALAKNEALYGNPLFPLLDGVFRDPTALERHVLARFTTMRFDAAWALRCVAGVAGSGLLAAFALRWTDRLLAALAIGWVAVWAFALNFPDTGDAGRFLVPLSSLVLLAAARQPGAERLVGGLLVAQLAVYVATGPGAVLSFYAACLAVAAVVVVAAGSPPGTGAMERVRAWVAHPAWVAAVFGVIALARVASRFSADPAEVGYGDYRAQHALLRELVAQGHTVGVDFYPLSLDLRLDPGLVVLESALAGERYVALAASGSADGLDYLFVRPEHVRRWPWPEGSVTLTEVQRIGPHALLKVESRASGR